MEHVVCEGLVQPLEGCGRKGEERIVGVLRGLKVDEDLANSPVKHAQAGRHMHNTGVDFGRWEDEVRKVVRGENDKAVEETKENILKFLERVV